MVEQAESKLTLRRHYSEMLPYQDIQYANNP